jgi:tetratricopeptide (TPR) repeat protein
MRLVVGITRMNSISTARKFANVVLLLLMCCAFGMLVALAEDRADVHRLQEKSDSGVDLYTSRIKRDPGDSSAYEMRAECYSESGKYVPAIEDCSKVIALSPKQPRAYCHRGLMYIKAKQYEKAIADCNTAIGLNPLYAWSYDVRGWAYGEIGQHRRAIQDLDKAISLDPHRAQTYLDRGLIYAKLGEYAKAVDDYSKAIDISSGFVWAYKDRALAYDKLGKKDLADKDRAKVREIESRDALSEDPVIGIDVNNAGTVRVNNLASLEALLNIIANRIELVLVIVGAICIVFGLRRVAGCASLKHINKIALVTIIAGLTVGSLALCIWLARYNYYSGSEEWPFLFGGLAVAGGLSLTMVPKGYRKLLIVGVVFMLVGLMIPGIVNWCVATARDANLFY